MQYAKPMLEKQLNADFASTPFSGNPITGLYASNLVLSRGGEDLLTADEAKITVSFKGSAQKHTLKLKLEAKGVKTSLDKFNRLIPHTDTPGPSNIILSEVILDDSYLDTKFGTVKLDDSKVTIDNSQTYGLDIKGSLDNTLPFSAVGGITKLDGNWTADKLRLTVDEGSASADGALYPNSDVKISTKQLNLSRIAELFPDVRRLGIRGILTSELSFKGNGAQFATEGRLTLENALVRGIPLELLSVRWNYADKKLNAVFNEENRANAALTGTLKLDGGKSFLDADLAAQKLHLAAMTEQFKHQLGSAKTLPQGTITGAKIKLKGPLNALVGSIELLPSTIAYGKLSFKDFKGSAVFDGHARGKVNFSAMHAGKPITLTGILAFADNVQNDLNFSAAGFRLEELHDSIPALKKAGVKGAVNVDASVTGVIKKLRLNAKVSSNQLTADSVGTISDIRVDGGYLLDTGSVELKNLSAAWNGAKLNVSGSMDNTKRKPELNISGHISNLQTETLHPMVAFMRNISLRVPINADFKASGALSNPQISAQLASSGGTVMKGLVINSANAVLTYANNSIIVEPLNISTPHGTLKSWAHSIIKGGTDWSWEADFDGVETRIINGLFGMNEDIRGRMSGKIKLYSIGQGMRWTGNFSKARLRWRTFHFDSITGVANGTKDLVNLDRMKFEICGGKGIANGSVTIGSSLDTSMLNVDLNASKINIYEVIRRHLPQISNIQGLAETSCKVSGSIAKPLFTGQVKLAPLRISTAYIPEAAILANAGLSHLHCKKIDVRLPEGTAEGKAFLRKKDNVWHSRANLAGKGIDLSKLLRFAPDDVRKMLKGSVDASIECDCPLNELMAKGSVTSNELEIKGLKLENVNAPFYYSDKYFVAEDLSCSSNKGTIHGGIAYNTATGQWGASCNVKDIDIDTMFKDIVDKPAGKITGSLELKMRVGGRAFNMGSMSAAGIVSASDGEISGFKFLETAKKFTKNKPIRFKKANTTFRYDNETLIFLPGTQAVAPDGDPFYRMAMADGYITRKGDMSINCLGKFNIRALNSLLGGVSGLVDMSRTITTQGINNIDTRELLQNVLGGVLSGATRSSFRFVTLGFSGSVKEPKLTKLLVESDARSRRSKYVTIPTSNSDPTEKQMHQDGDWTFKLHFEIPVGYGKNTEAADIKGQFMQDTLKSLISNITF